MNSNVVVKPSAEEVASAACFWLIESITESIAYNGRCVLALSGGSTPKKLYERIAREHLGTLDWSKVHLLWGDERNVPHDHPESNFLMVKTAWLDPAMASGDLHQIPKFYPVPIEPHDPEKSAYQYGQTIRSVLGDSPTIDVVLLGLGDDAHTASLFPETQALESLDGFVANYVSKFEAFRLTMTASLINRARRVAFLVCGESKSPALDVVWHGPKDPTLYPAQWINPTEGELWWFLDMQALPARDRVV
ncbi:MAG: 6-phosphogluconolactonase [Planctomycetota bacterium]|nr:6-phosphogluconolactonase [Planctomycetota bacterium]